MKVLILCGGVGTRLKEETEFKPKPMVKIGEFPILWHIMRHYSHFGHNEFVLALGHKGEMIKDYFLHYQHMCHDFTVDLSKKDSIEFHDNKAPHVDWKVTLVNTGELALKGARMKRAQPYIEDGLEGEEFLMTYGDGVSSVDLDALLKFHKGHGKSATVTGVVPSMRFGELRAKEDGSVEFKEKERTGAALINGGYYVLNKSVFDRLEDDDSCDFEYGPLEEMSQEGNLRMYSHEGFWHCMDNLRDVEALNSMWTSDEKPWVVWE